MHVFHGNKKACQSNIAGRNIIRFYRLHYKLLGKQHFKGAIYGRMEMVAGDRPPKTAEFGSQIVDTWSYDMVGTLKQNLKSWILRRVTGWSAP